MKGIQIFTNKYYSILKKEIEVSVSIYSLLYAKVSLVAHGPLGFFFRERHYYCVEKALLSDDNPTCSTWNWSCTVNVICHVL